MLRNVIKECREFIAIDGGEVIMRITRKNRFWRDIILSWIEDRDVADATVGLLHQNYWSKRCISSNVGIINNGVVDEEEISFHVLKNFCILFCEKFGKEEEYWPHGYVGLEYLEMIARRGLKTNR